MNQSAVTVAIIDALTAAGIVTGDGEAPDDGGWNDAMTVHEPYAVVFPLPGGTRTGPLDDHEADGTLVYQVSCVGVTRDSAERLVDDVGAAVAGMQDTVAGDLRIVLVRNDFGSHQVRRADDVEPTEPVLFYGTPRYRLWVTPNGAP